MSVFGAVRTHCGKVRSQNEDAFGFFPDLQFYVVADGMGGQVYEARASTLAVATLWRSLQDLPQSPAHLNAIPGELSRLQHQNLATALQDANTQVLERRHHQPELVGMGTTVAAVMFAEHEKMITIGHVGNTRVYRIRAATVEQLTEDHSVGQELMREGWIRPEEIPTCRQRYILTQAIGIRPTIQPTVRVKGTQTGDRFLLCSDGVYRKITDEEILDTVLATGEDLQQACDRLVDLANDRGGQDNMTALLLRCDDDREAVRGLREE